MKVVFKMIHLVEYVGEAAVYEHLAEECSELAQAALKYARYLRGDNPMDSNVNEGVLLYNVKEESTDILILLEELGLEKGSDEVYCRKLKRMLARLIDAGKTRNDG